MGASNTTAKLDSGQKLVGSTDQRAGGQKRRVIKARIGPYSSKVLEESKATGIGKKDFRMLKVLGRGSYGKVCQVEHIKTGTIYAMKIIAKDTVFKKRQEEHTMTERRILERINHPFIVSLNYAFQTPEKLYLVIDYHNGGELFFHLKNARGFSEKRANFYIAETILALEHLHTLDIVYRDLKPENVLLDDQGHVKLTDFGLSKEGIALPNGTTTFCGTPEYLAPEVLAGEAYGKPIDVWSLGNFCYEIVIGRPPFYAKNRNEMYERILNATPKFPSWISQQYKDAILAMLTKDPDERPTLTQLKRHRNFKGINWEKLGQKLITPPFIPVTEGMQDCSNFEDEFTNQIPEDTPVNCFLTPVQQQQFEGFTYEGENPLNT